MKQKREVTDCSVTSRFFITQTSAHKEHMRLISRQIVHPLTLLYNVHGLHFASRSTLSFRSL